MIDVQVHVFAVNLIDRINDTNTDKDILNFNCHMIQGLPAPRCVWHLHSDRD